MGVVRDITVEQLAQAVGGIDTSALAKDSTLQATNTALSNINNTLGGITTNDPPTDTTQQSIASAISGLGQTLGANKADIDGSNIANPGAFLSSLGFGAVTVTPTTGTTQYNGYYYGDYALSVDKSKIYSLTVIEVDSNRPAFAQLLINGNLRVWTTVASTAVTVRINYIN